jgi:hypothetical protein
MEVIGRIIQLLGGSLERVRKRTTDCLLAGTRLAKSIGFDRYLFEIEGFAQVARKLQRLAQCFGSGVKLQTRNRGEAGGTEAGTGAALRLGGCHVQAVPEFRSARAAA